MLYKYGMRARGCSIGCQPKGLAHCENADKIKTGYWSYIYYEVSLSNEELNKYELDFIKEVKVNEIKKV